MSAEVQAAISSAFSSVCVVVSLLFLTPLFTYIPKAALAAMVISAVLLLFHPKAVFNLWKMNRHDGIVAITVFVISLIAKPDYALLIGVMISLMFFLWKTMHPRIVRVTKDPELLTEYARASLRRSISKQYQDEEGKLPVIALDHRLEETLAAALQRTEQGSFLEFLEALRPLLALALEPLELGLVEVLVEPLEPVGRALAHSLNRPLR